MLLKGCEPVKALSGMYCYARLNRTAALSTLSTKRYVPERLHRMAVVSFENASNRYGAPKNQGARMVNTVSQSHLIVSNPVKKTLTPRTVSRPDVTGTSVSEDTDPVLVREIYHELNSRELNQELQDLGTSQNWRFVFKVFDSLCETPNVTYSTWEESFDGSADTCLLPNAYVATTVLSIAGRHGDLDRVRSTWSWMRAQGPGRSAPTAWTYTAYIQAVGAFGKWEEAFDVYREMRSEGVMPTSHTFSALIRAGAQGNRAGATAAVALVANMRADGIKPDVPIASALICAYGVLGQFTNAERMLRAVETFAGDDEDAHDFASNIGIVSSKGALKIREDALTCFRPDARLYTEFIIAACRCGKPTAAVEVFLSPNFPKTSYTCTAAIKAYGDLSEWERAEDIYVLMCRCGDCMAPNGITCSALLSAYEKCGQWRRAIFFLSRLRAARRSSSGEKYTALKIEEIHYNIAISACGKCGKWSYAERLFDEMIKYDISQSNITYSTLIAAYGRGGEQKRAYARYNEMLAKGLKPDDYTFVGLMLSPASCGNLSACLDIKEQMHVHGVVPTVHVYNELIRAADVARRYETAVEIFQEMVKKGIEPNATTREMVQDIGKKGVEYYEDQQAAANFASFVAGLVGVAGMMAGRW
jgi:pentatricopeptide repeat protein